MISFSSFFLHPFPVGGNKERDVVDTLGRLRVRTRQKATSPEILQFEGKDNNHFLCINKNKFSQYHLGVHLDIIKIKRKRRKTLMIHYRVQT